MGGGAVNANLEKVSHFEFFLGPFPYSIFCLLHIINTFLLGKYIFLLNKQFTLNLTCITFVRILAPA